METQKHTNTKLKNGQDPIYNDEYLEESLTNLFAVHANQNQHYYLTKCSSPNFQIRIVERIIVGILYLFTIF